MRPFQVTEAGPWNRACPQQVSVTATPIVAPDESLLQKPTPSRPADSIVTTHWRYVGDRRLIPESGTSNPCRIWPQLSSQGWGPFFSMRGGRGEPLRHTGLWAFSRLVPPILTPRKCLSLGRLLRQ
jgi:hypothetical protein